MKTISRNLSIAIRPCSENDTQAIESLGKKVFGPGRFSRAAFRLREGVSDKRSLQYAAEIKGNVSGSVRLTPVTIGGLSALVLGPLMIAPEFGRLGIGRELMNYALDQARRGGHPFVVLVGDLSYYERFGFQVVESGRITFPGPCDPQRILALELTPGASEKYSGPIQRVFG